MIQAGVPVSTDDTTSSDELAAYFDAASPDDIRWFLAERDDVCATMAYFDRRGFEFVWYEPNPAHDTSRVANLGFQFWSSLDPSQRVGSDRDLLNEWIPRIKAHSLDVLGVGRRRLEPGFHQVRYQLTTPGGYLREWKRESDAA